MPKVASNQRANFTIKGSYHYVEYDIHYYKFKGSGYGSSPTTTAFFMAIPKKQELVIDFKGVDDHYSGGKTNWGFIAKSESEAETKLKEYFNKYFTEDVKEELVIIIPKKINTRWLRECKTEKEVLFKFYVYNKITASASVKYIESDYQKKQGDNNIHRTLDDKAILEFTVLPYSKELLEKCELICKRFDEIQQMINKAFGTIEQALETLNAQKLLL